MFLPSGSEDRWREILAHYDHLPASLEPLGDLVRGLAHAPALEGVTITTSHEVPIFTTASRHQDFYISPCVSVEYWPQADRFRIRLHGIDGIPYDEKWCALPEAVATVKYSCRRMTSAALAR